MLELTCGRLVGSWITGTESICFDYYRDGDKFSYN